MSMMNGHCDRCGKPTTTFRMSMYNTEMCCKDCLEAEQKRPDYEEARKAELEQVRQGNYNYKGIGL
jgi:recombinational DNA repair protein (RecF pathway)